MSIIINSPPKNYRDAYEEDGEEFCIVVSPYNDNILSCIDPLDLHKENDYFPTDYQGKGQTLILVFCRERILSGILFEGNFNPQTYNLLHHYDYFKFVSLCMLVTTQYGVAAPNLQYYPYYFS
uniref:Uncharacterized protein n=1 Tax=Lactuca sativa TaxID=4236 RepID=A0A9R1XLP7_LACSA|nr:hypothetical protein LSAT_V11C300106310 [Lactuca sativa]